MKSESTTKSCVSPVTQVVVAASPGAEYRSRKGACKALFGARHRGIDSAADDREMTKKQAFAVVARRDLNGPGRGQARDRAGRGSRMLADSRKRVSGLAAASWACAGGSRFHRCVDSCGARGTVQKCRFGPHLRWKAGIAERICDAASVDAHLSRMRPPGGRRDADRRMPVLLSVQRLRRASQAEAGRLLRVLLLRHCPVSAQAGGRCMLWVMRNSRGRLRVPTY
jgi:hypothetical protein